MGLIAKVIRISHAKLHCSRLTTVQDIQDYASLVFLGHIGSFIFGLAFRSAELALTGLEG